MSIKQNKLKKISRVKTISQMSLCFSVFGALCHVKTKSSTPHLASNEVFRLTFIEAFQLIDLIFAIRFSIWACTLMKK